MSVVSNDCLLGNMSVLYENNNASFFEGAEKLLEIWFYDPSEIDEFNNAEIFDSTNNVCKILKPSLRNIPREEFVKMLDCARCHILHTKSNSHMDSYVLSESSMFISDRRFILKTCGTTDLLQTVSHILNLAKKYSNLNSVANVYYSRKNLLRPHLQPELHKCFNNEVQHLDTHFQDGGAYCMGSIKDDRWYLYIINNPQAPPTCADHSLEILMNDMPNEILKIFTKTKYQTGEECTRRGGIKNLMPLGTVVHEELFEPVGYSMNGLIPDSDQYVTIHITPELDFSFVSFETNQRRECLYKQTMKVLNCFKPNRIIINVFSNDLSKNGKKTQMRIWQDEIPGYKRVNLQILRFQHDTLVYAQFNRDMDNPANYRLSRNKFNNNYYDDHEDDINESD